MLTTRSGLEIVLLIFAAASVVAGLSRGLNAAERRGWVRLHGVGKGSASVAFAAMEDMFAAGRSEARQLLEEQERVGNRAPSPGDWLDDEPAVMGRFAGKLVITDREQAASKTGPTSSRVAIEGTSAP